MKFARIVFFVAGAYGFIVLAPAYFLEKMIDRQQPPAITHPEFFYGFVGLGLAWQFLFLILASDPVRYRPMILPCIVEKVSYGMALIALFALQRIPFSVLAFGSMDWVFAVLFVAAYLKTGPIKAHQGDTGNAQRA